MRVFSQRQDGGLTWGKAGQVVPADVEVTERLQLAHLRRESLDLIAAHVLQGRRGEAHTCDAVISSV